MGMSIIPAAFAFSVRESFDNFASCPGRVSMVVQEKGWVLGLSMVNGRYDML
jgi:hypothetical protein